MTQPKHPILGWVLRSFMAAGLGMGRHGGLHWGLVRGPLLGLLLIGVLVSAGAASATIYVAMPDRALLEQADLVAEVTVLNKLGSLAGTPAATDYLAVVNRTVKGIPGRQTIVLRSPGGSSMEGDELAISGAPELRSGDRLLAFLYAEGGNRYSILHLGLGAFFRHETDTGVLALRSLTGTTLLDFDLEPTSDPGRDYEGFIDWLARRQRGQIEPASYFRRGEAAAASDGGIGPAVEPFRLTKVNRKPLRWFEFDDRKTIPWKIRSTDSNGTQSQFTQSLKTWSRCPVDLRLVGGTGSTNGLSRSDGTNALIFGDPKKNVVGIFSCTMGGVLAAGGIWFDPSSTGTYKGMKYIRIREADIVINDGTECLLSTNKTAAAELFTHEIGHTVGIDHSEKSDATMAAFFHNDGRGSSLRSDDIKALETLYGTCSSGDGGGSEPEPDDPEPAAALVPPSNLRAMAPKAKLVRLRWNDNSKDETAFQIWRRIKAKRWKLWQTVPANTKVLTSDQVRPGTPYTFRVRALRGREASEYSNEAQVKTPANRLAAPSELTVEATSPTEGVLTWKDTTTGEAKFLIERKQGDDEWQPWKSADANSTSKEFGDGVSGATYSFRMRAKKAAKFSKYSNIATVTMP